MYCMFFKVFVKIPRLHHTVSVSWLSINQVLSSPEIKDITWSRGDMKFLFEKRNFVHVPPSEHVMF